MPGIPPALDSDTEDVTWALQTAEALWKRNERADALVWLRRAAQAAGAAEHDDRAFGLAQKASELAESVSGNRAAVKASSPGSPSGLPDEPRTTQTDEVEEVSVYVALESDPILERDRLDTPTLPDDSPAPRLASPPPPRAVSIPPRHVPSAAERHAGLLDPWAESGSRSGRASELTVTSNRARVLRAFEADEVVTSAPAIVRMPMARAAPLDLSRVEALSDLPDDAREAFGRTAVVRRISHGEQLSGFALALVVEGSVYLAATIVDTPAQRLEAGEVIRARGTTEHIAPVRLVAATASARVATWDEQAVEHAFRTCPWVEDDLRAAGDRLQALVGVTMGALGERLDPQLRAHVASHLTLRALSEHEVFASRGKPVPGLLIVGAGELELVGDDGAPEGTVLRPGDFLFPNEVLLAAPAPTTVRASKGGALILFADRRAAQELLMTCPPLLEIFAGA